MATSECLSLYKQFKKRNSPWIQVTDINPPLDEPVLVLVDGITFGIAEKPSGKGGAESDAEWAFNDDWLWTPTEPWHFKRREHLHVTHWMPLEVPIRETRTVSSYENVINSWDVNARIEELKTCQQDAEGVQKQEIEEEIEVLERLAEEARPHAEGWEYGATLIRDSYFEDYAKELTKEIGDISKIYKWPASCIDWKKAASQLQENYSSVKFDGVTYWIR